MRRMKTVDENMFDFFDDLRSEVGSIVLSFHGSVGLCSFDLAN